MFLFFASMFSSLLWLIYVGIFVYNRFSMVDMTSVDAYTLALYTGLVLIPVWLVWQVFGSINQYFKNKATNKKLEQLFNQMKKNQDYTDLVVRVMLDAEHEIKDGFVVGKFDVFVADMNEILADIAQRSNAASSIKIDELWQRVKNGERWSIAKAFIENSKSRDNFEEYLKDKSNRDPIFKGTLLEFCARYQNLSNMLEQHDRDRIFITILETGVMGKVYSMFAPIVSELTAPLTQKEEKEEKEEAPLQTQTADISAEINAIEAPADDAPVPVFKKLPKLPKFSAKEKKKTAVAHEEDDEAFFSALKQRMTENDNQEPKLSVPTDQVPDEPRLQTPQNLPQEETEAISSKELHERQEKSLKAFLEEEPKTEGNDTKSDENLAYPFNGWTDAS